MTSKKLDEVKFKLIFFSSKFEVGAEKLQLFKSETIMHFRLFHCHLSSIMKSTHLINLQPVNKMSITH